MKPGFFRAVATALCLVTFATSANAESQLPSHNASDVEGFPPRRLSAYHDNSYEIRMACGVDFPGADLYYEDGSQTKYKLGAANCYVACDWWINDCMGAVWTDQDGGTCYFKKAMSIYGTPKGNAKSTMYVKKGTWNEELFWVYPFYNCDMAGNDVGNERQTYPAACAKPCANRMDCWAWTWTNYNGGTCWFKSQARECVANNGATSGYVWRNIFNTDTCMGLKTTGYW